MKKFLFLIIILTLFVINGCAKNSPHVPTVYCAGVYGDLANGKSCFWKGTERTDLPDYGQVCSIYVE